MSSEKKGSTIYTSVPVQAVGASDDVAGPAMPDSYTEAGGDAVARSVRGGRAIDPAALESALKAAHEPPRGVNALRELFEPKAGDLAAKIKAAAERDLAEKRAAEANRELEAARRNYAGPAKSPTWRDVETAIGALVGREVGTFDHGSCVHVRRGAPIAAAISLVNYTGDQSLYTDVCAECASEITAAVGEVLRSAREQVEAKPAEPNKRATRGDTLRSAIVGAVMRRVWPKNDAAPGLLRSLRAAAAIGIATLLSDEVRAHVVGEP